jgi:hypothetical protein
MQPKLREIKKALSNKKSKRRWGKGRKGGTGKKKEPFFRPGRAYGVHKRWRLKAKADHLHECLEKAPRVLSSHGGVNELCSNDPRILRKLILLH